MLAVAYTLIPLAAMVLGAMAAATWTPSASVRSAVQHFAAGVVFAAAASEILPDLKHEGAAIPVAIGGAIGIAIMLVVRAVGERAASAAGMVAVTGVDILIDGLVLGIGFAAGAREGLLLTIALTIEILFLGLTMAFELRQAMPSRVKAVAITCAIGLLLPIGALAGGPISRLPGPYLTAFFAFGLIALLYLVTEELLVEAHEGPESPIVAAMFFVGFLLLLLLEESLA
jgi:ZIP family zinc transporter